jgi:hypothetical protein
MRSNASRAGKSSRNMPNASYKAAKCLPCTRSSRYISGPAGRTEQSQVVPGPFALAPQTLGGYTVAKGANLDGAIAWVQRFPTGGVFEIRPLVEG